MRSYLSLSQKSLLMLGLLALIAAFSTAFAESWDTKRNRAHRHCHEHGHRHGESGWKHRHRHCHEHRHKMRRGDEHIHEEMQEREHRRDDGAHRRSNPNHSPNGEHPGRSQRRYRDEDDGDEQHNHRQPEYSQPPVSDIQAPPQEYAPLPYHSGPVQSEYIKEGNCDRDGASKIAGTIIGGLIGSQLGKGDGKTAATVLGAIIGHQIAKKEEKKARKMRMARGDENCTAQSLEYVPNNQPTQWQNPDNNTQYTVTPTKTYQAGGQYCREFTSQANVGGQNTTVYGTACRQPDGAWKVTKYQ